MRIFIRMITITRNTNNFNDFNLYIYLTPVVLPRKIVFIIFQIKLQTHIQIISFHCPGWMSSDTVNRPRGERLHITNNKLYAMHKDWKCTKTPFRICYIERRMSIQKEISVVRTIQLHKAKQRWTKSSIFQRTQFIITREYICRTKCFVNFWLHQFYHRCAFQLWPSTISKFNSSPYRIRAIHFSIKIRNFLNRYHRIKSTTELCIIHSVPELHVSIWYLIFFSPRESFHQFWI